MSKLIYSSNVLHAVKHPTFYLFSFCSRSVLVPFHSRSVLFLFILVLFPFRSSSVLFSFCFHSHLVMFFFRSHSVLVPFSSRSFLVLFSFRFHSVFILFCSRTIMAHYSVKCSCVANKGHWMNWKKGEWQVANFKVSETYARQASRLAGGHLIDAAAAGGCLLSSTRGQPSLSCAHHRTKHHPCWTTTSKHQCTKDHHPCQTTEAARKGSHLFTTF